MSKQEKTYFSTSTNFRVTVKPPKKNYLTGEVDPGKTIEFTSVAGAKGTSWGSRYVTSDAEEIKFLDTYKDPWFSGEKYELPPTAQTYFNADIEQVRRAEIAAVLAMQPRQSSQGR